MTESNELYAVRFGDFWSIAKKVKASEYGFEPAVQDVWSEQGTTALVGIVGKEDAAIALRTPSDGEVVAWQHNLTGIIRTDKPAVGMGLHEDYTPLYARPQGMEVKPADDVCWHILSVAYEEARYQPGDHPVVPVKLARFMEQVGHLLSTTERK